MKISIIILTLNAEKHIKKLINELLRQNKQAAEILVIDSSSNDRTQEIVRSYENNGVKLHQIQLSDFNHGGTRRLGMELTSGDIVIMMTQDAIPYNDQLIENLIKPFKDKKVASSYARQLPRRSATPPERFARQFNYPNIDLMKGKEDLPKLGIKTFFCSDVCHAIRRSAYNKAGGFVKNAIMSEDIFLGAKFILAGYKIAYSPKAQVIHSHHYTTRQQFDRYFDIGKSYSKEKWMLKYAKSEKEGLRFVKEELKFLLKNKHFLWLPNMALETSAKLLGYKIGLNHTKIPKRILEFITKNKYTWRPRSKHSS